MFRCDSFFSSPVGSCGVAITYGAWPNSLIAQLFDSHVGVYFRQGIFPLGSYLNCEYFEAVVYGSFCIYCRVRVVHRRMDVGPDWTNVTRLLLRFRDRTNQKRSQQLPFICLRSLQHPRSPVWCRFDIGRGQIWDQDQTCEFWIRGLFLGSVRLWLRVGDSSECWSVAHFKIEQWKTGRFHWKTGRNCILRGFGFRRFWRLQSRITAYETWPVDRNDWAS